MTRSVQNVLTTQHDACMHACIHVLRGMHLGLSCAALCFIWSPTVSTWTPTGSWRPLYPFLLLCGLPVRCLPSRSCVRCLFQLLLIYTQHSVEEVWPSLATHKVCKEFSSSFGKCTQTGFCPIPEMAFSSSTLTVLCCFWRSTVVSRPFFTPIVPV